jgi:hypothetical protein
MLIIFNPELVRAPPQAAGSSVGGSGLVIPGVDDQSPIKPDPHPIIAGSAKAVHPRRDIDVASPASRETVGRDKGVIRLALLRASIVQGSKMTARVE